MDEGTQLSFLTILPLFTKLLTNISFVLVRVIEPLKCRVRELTVNFAPRTRVLIVVFALLWQVKMLVGGSSVVERLVRVDAVVPVVIF